MKQDHLNQFLLTIIKIGLGFDQALEELTAAKEKAEMEEEVDQALFELLQQGYRVTEDLSECVIKSLK